jgi:hypothetical protein
MPLVLSGAGFPREKRLELSELASHERTDLTKTFFIRSHGGYASVRSELCETIRETYGIEHGTICGVRWKRRKGSYGAWRIQAYWHESGAIRTKVLGELTEVWSRIATKVNKAFVAANDSSDA